MNDITGVRRYAMNLVSILSLVFRSFDYFTFHSQRIMDKKKYGVKRYTFIKYCFKLKRLNHPSYYIWLNF